MAQVIAKYRIAKGACGYEYGHATLTEMFAPSMHAGRCFLEPRLGDWEPAQNLQLAVGTRISLSLARLALATQLSKRKRVRDRARFFRSLGVERAARCSWNWERHE